MQKKAATSTLYFPFGSTGYQAANQITPLHWLRYNCQADDPNEISGKGKIELTNKTASSRDRKYFVRINYQIKLRRCPTHLLYTCGIWYIINTFKISKIIRSVPAKGKYAHLFLHVSN